jgi:NAD(P)H-flavin reductase
VNATLAPGAGSAPVVKEDPMVPRSFVVTRTRRETHDTATLWLAAVDGTPLAFEPGQFTMLQAYGVGEVPLSISGDPADDGVLHLTVRDVGSVSHALANAETGAQLGVRGPFGVGWDVGSARGRDVVIVAGGIGLAPLRPAVLEICANRAAYGEVTLLYGARTPDERLFTDELPRWATEHAVAVHVTVDRGNESWRGPVGLVTSLVDRTVFRPDVTTVLVCGPEVMMRHTAAAFLDRGVAPTDVRVSMERNMKCGIGLCGHCQLRELFICLDGPVLGYDRLGSHLTQAEL